MMRKNKGFTLVELLAVIVLLGILMLLTFPRIIEMTNSQNAKISNAKLLLMKTAAKSYIADHKNQYPAKEGNTFCISVESLQSGNYLAFDDSEIDLNYVIKVSYFSEKEYELSYVKGNTCTDVGLIEDATTKPVCKLAKSGNAQTNMVTITYPQPEDAEYEYYYSLDEGKNWKEVSSFDGGRKVNIKFTTSGSVTAKVVNKSDFSTLTCSASVEIDDTPVGTIVAYAGKTIPSGYILADGTLLQISKYQELYNAIGDTYGTSPDSAYFYIPSIKGKTVIGTGNYTEKGSTTTYNLGNMGGESAHKLTINELPSHTHTFTGTKVTTLAGGKHTHTYSGTTDEKSSMKGIFSILAEGDNAVFMDDEVSIFDEDYSMASLSSGSAIGFGKYRFIDQNHTHTFTAVSTPNNTGHTHNYSAKGTNGNTGNDEAHNNLMPYITMNYIIKYQ